MAKIKAPNALYNGESAGIQFSKGVAETDNPWLIQWFKENGYSVSEEPKEDSAEEEYGEGNTEDLSGKNMAELKEIADEHGLEYDSKIKKDDLIKLLENEEVEA
ncbi:HeH/LEM domain-containing protein [Atopococcus tabaci]|uniref:HeH/LEM domain-containing protein n=1 Tax=Atopococcus tabaci TaxID=269774 RepID=UPI00240936D1|nr:HeH/LEM domain-containing protein [Atopococcus tabaci]